MPAKRNKRGAASHLSSTLSPTTPPARNIAMEDSLASLHAKFDSFGTQLAKIDVLEQTINTLVQENIACREEMRKKDVVIEQLSEKVNRLDQSMRATSLRIHGLPVTSATPTNEVANIVYQEIMMPIFAAAKQNGDLNGDSFPALYSTVVNTFAIPSKKNTTSSPVIVKFYSEYIRGLVFKHKKNALPTAADLNTNRIRQKYAIYEDLTTANHQLLRSFADDPRVLSTWSFGGQIRFKTHLDDTIYKASSLSATYESLVKPPSIASSNPNANPVLATRQQMRNRVPLFDDP
jgi:hypothetical protein